mmetsp:Transcript_89815/g.231911  ORF Transcript_89815/g.231911 Transcript_89815/m.231911 type:complete len:350 (+) Transcript_89815:462-1511(+)
MMTGLTLGTPLAVVTMLTVTAVLAIIAVPAIAVTIIAVPAMSITIIAVLAMVAGLGLGTTAGYLLGIVTVAEHHAPLTAPSAIVAMLAVATVLPLHVALSAPIAITFLAVPGLPLSAPLAATVALVLIAMLPVGLLMPAFLMVFAMALPLTPFSGDTPRLTWLIVLRLPGRPPLLVPVLIDLEEGVAQELPKENSELLLRKHAIAVLVRGLEELLEGPFARRLQAQVLIKREGEHADLAPLQGPVPVRVEALELLLAGVREHRRAAEEGLHVLGIVGVDGTHGGPAEISQRRCRVARVPVVVSEDLRNALSAERGEPLTEVREEGQPFLLPRPQKPRYRRRHRAQLAGP